MDTDLAQRLIASRANGDFAPAWLVGAIDLHQALDLQLAVLDDLVERGATVGGWKVGLTSESSRQKLGADERPFGFVLADRVLASRESVAAAAIRDLSIEAEMCFTMGADIADPDIGPDRILDFVAEVSAGLELNEARPGSARPDFPVLVTDCLTNWGIVNGTGIAPGPDHALTATTLSATTVRMFRNGTQVFEGVSSDHLDDHAVSLCRLVEQLARHGRGLLAGQRVITGAFARFAARPGERWACDFDGIGRVEVQVV